MIFASPMLAWAAIGAAFIPIILHLLLRRPRITPWGSNYLLQIAFAKIQRRRRFEKWLLLALRILAISLVGLAAAGPFSKSWNTEGQLKERWIIIDDGATSAEITTGGLNVLEELKSEIVRSTQGHTIGDRFALVLSSIPARVLLEPTSSLELLSLPPLKSLVQRVPSWMLVPTIRARVLRIKLEQIDRRLFVPVLTEQFQLSILQGHSSRLL